MASSIVILPRPPLPSLVGQTFRCPLRPLTVSVHDITVERKAQPKNPLARPSPSPPRSGGEGRGEVASLIFILPRHSLPSLVGRALRCPPRLLIVSVHDATAERKPQPKNPLARPSPSPPRSGGEGRGEVAPSYLLVTGILPVSSRSRICPTHPPPRPSHVQKNRGPVLPGLDASKKSILVAITSATAAATAVAAAAAAVFTTTAAATGALFTRLGNVDCQGPAVHFLAVQTVNRLLGFFG